MRITTASLILGIVVLAPAVRGRADIPPVGPVLLWRLQLESHDDAYDWIAYPMNYSIGAPFNSYARVTPGRPFDTGRSSSPRIWAFPTGHDALPPMPETGGDWDPFHAFFEAQQIPRSIPVAEPHRDPLLAAGIRGVVDIYEPTVAGDVVQLRLLRSEYTFEGGRPPETIAAHADGSRTMPLPPSSAAAAATAVSSGCGCAVPGNTAPLGALFALAGVALFVVLRRRR